MQVFPGEAKPALLRDLLPDDAAYVTYRLETNMHTGTHIDAPFHAKADELTIDSYEVGLFSGKACVIDVRGMKTIEMNADWITLFADYKIVLFCTGYSSQWDTDSYYFEYPEFETAIAEYLVKAGVRIAGFDSPSPDKDPFQFHSVFLRDNRFLVENLCNLELLLDKEQVVFSAFPLKITAEASLVRAVAQTGV